jgi:hypothetical protein
MGDYEHGNESSDTLKEKNFFLLATNFPSKSCSNETVSAIEVLQSSRIQLFFLLPPDIISLQLCTPKFVFA